MALSERKGDSENVLFFTYKNHVTEFYCNKFDGKPWCWLDKALS